MFNPLDAASNRVRKSRVGLTTASVLTVVYFHEMVSLDLRMKFRSLCKLGTETLSCRDRKGMNDGQRCKNGGTVVWNK